MSSDCSTLLLVAPLSALDAQAYAKQLVHVTHLAVLPWIHFLINYKTVVPYMYIPHFDVQLTYVGAKVAVRANVAVNVKSPC